MSFKRIQYTGRKLYRDQTPLRNLWEPGDTKLVTLNDAQRLLRFAEFRAAETETAKPVAEVGLPKTEIGLQETEKAKEAAELEQAQIEQARLAEEQEQKRVAHQNLLLEIDTMDKAALEAYAKDHYNIDLDKRLSVGKLRDKVTELVEGYGAGA